MAEKYFGKKYEYMAVEWLWDEGKITIYHADTKNLETDGYYIEVLQQLNQLGEYGWKIVSASASSNWILWVLTREYEGERKRFSLPEFTPRDG